MTARLPTALVTSALIRRVGLAGGFATVIGRGSDHGTILIQAMEDGRFGGFFERMTGFDGVASLVRCGPAEDAAPTEIAAYCARRRTMDEDLWIVELDIADAQRFAAETILY